jgi:hypothetical protein
MAQTTIRYDIGRAERLARLAARQAVRHARPWVEWLARFGYAARGVVYAFIGFLAFEAASGMGGETTGPRGALYEIARKSRVLLAFVALGLLGYAVWRFVQAIADPENKGSDAKGLASRGLMLVTGIIYGSLAVAAVRLLTGMGGGAAATSDGVQGMTAGVLGKPFGAVLVSLVGLGIIAGGLDEIWKGWKQKFRDVIDFSRMSPTERTWMIRTGVAGLIARGVVFVLTGSFLVQAALRSDPSRARGLPGALQTLAQQPYGPWLLGLVALGLLAFGVYSLLLARYRRIYF